MEVLIMMERIKRWLGSGIIVIGLISILDACTFSPGMHMDASKSIVLSKTTDTRAARIIPITGRLIEEQISQYLENRQSVVTKSLVQVSNDEYRVGSHDILQITVWDHPELTIPAGQFRTSTEAGNLVREDGTIFYPYIGIVSVAGHTTEEIRIILAEHLSMYIEKPQIDVRVAAYRSKKAYVTGMVKNPSIIPITDQPLKVLDAIGQSGGTLPEADLENVLLVRNGVTYRLNVLNLLMHGEVNQNIALLDGDVINIPDNALNKVFVLGEVVKPSSLLIHNGRMTLAEAISDVEGFDLRTSNPGKVYVIRGGYSSEDSHSLKTNNEHVNLRSLDKIQIYHLDASSPAALILADQFRLRSRDVVYVSQTSFTRLSRALDQISNIVNITARTVILERAINQ